MHLDWYQATIQAPPKVIQEAILDAKLAFKSEDQTMGGRGYKSSIRFSDQAGDSHLILFHGSTTAAPSLKASGEAADPVSAFIRRTWPDHSVSRVDVAQDFRDPGGFRKACRILKAIGKHHGVTSGFKILPTDPEKGATQYIGSPKSSAMARCYEKGREMLAKGLITAAEVDPDHYRVEFQLRPNKSEEKAMFARFEPTWMLGYSPWVRDAASKLLKVDAPIVERVKHQTAEIDRTFSFLMRQYQATLRKKAEADNNRFFGLVDPTREDLARIVSDLIHEELLNAWEDEDSKSHEYRDPSQRGRLIRSQPPTVRPKKDEDED